MQQLVCDRGCKHEDRFCLASHADACAKCDRDGEPTCSVGRFLVENFADCQRRFSNHSCGHLTGFTRRAHAALVHLGDAAGVADPSNRRGVIAAIAALLTCRSVQQELTFARLMVDSDQVWDESSATAVSNLFRGPR